METNHFYQALASRHRLFYSDWRRLVDLEGAWLDALFAPHGIKRVLDCTCGIGTQAIGLSLHGYQVTGTDAGEGNLDQARCLAAELGARVTWRPADVRRLQDARLDAPFDAVVSLGNSLPHLLTEEDLEVALRQMIDHTQPGGLLVIGQRDWDVITRQRPGFLFRHDHRDTPAPGHRTVLFDLWHYDDPLVTFEVFFLEHSPEGWHTEVFPVRYRMWQREQVMDLMKQAGMPEIKTVACDWEVRFAAQRLA